MSYNPQFIRHAFHPGFIGPAPNPNVPHLLSSDEFSRPDSSSNLGATDGGVSGVGAGTLDPLTWLQDTGTWGISSDRAWTVGTASPALAHVNLLTANIDLTITVGLSAFSSNGGLCFRMTDTSNYWRWTTTSAGNRQLFKVVAGSATQVGSNIAGGLSGDVLQVLAQGSSIDCLSNGVSLISATDSFNQTATLAGLLISLRPDFFLDHWIARSL